MQKYVRPLPQPDGSEVRVVIPNTSGTILPKEGAMVEDSSYWLRRAREGAVEYVEQPKADESAEPTKSKKSKE